VSPPLQSAAMRAEGHIKQEWQEAWTEWTWRRGR